MTAGMKNPGKRRETRSNRAVRSCKTFGESYLARADTTVT
jgi:hypothetical protein